MSKIDEMFKDNEKIIIDTLKQIRNSLYVEENFYEWQVAIDKILDLYTKEKEKNKSISIQYEKIVDKLEEQEKNKELEEYANWHIEHLTEDIADYILKETDCQELKNYILENKDYLYLSNEDEAQEIVKKYNESNLEETKQFIIDNYYDENKPEKEKRFTDIILITMFVVAVIMLIIAFLNDKYVLYK